MSLNDQWCIKDLYFKGRKDINEMGVSKDNSRLARKSFCTILTDGRALSDSSEAFANRSSFLCVSYYYIHMYFTIHIHMTMTRLALASWVRIPAEANIRIAHIIV